MKQYKLGFSRNVYDFLFADGIEALKAAIEMLNTSGSELISVSQYEHTYTVFFRKQLYG